MNNGIETKVAAGGVTGLALGLLFAYIPSVGHYISPQLAATLPPLIGAAAAYFAPHTPRLGDPAQVVTVTALQRELSGVVAALKRPQPSPPVAPSQPPAPAPLQAGNVGPVPS